MKSVSKARGKKEERVVNDQVRSFARVTCAMNGVIKSENSPQLGDTLNRTSCGAEWYCVRTHPKHEHIVAAGLKHLPGLEVFNPQLRLERLTRRGRVRSTESLFANYIFAQFVLESMLERVRYTPSVKVIVAFGERPAVIPAPVIEELRSVLAANEDTVFTDLPIAGDEAEILEGPFTGQHVTIAQVLPARQRVKVLMEVLGRSVPVEFSLSSLLFRRRTQAHSALGPPRRDWMLVSDRIGG